MRSIPSVVRHALAPLATSLLLAAGAAHAQMLIGWAQMPAATFSDGPTSGQFTAPNAYGTNVPPFIGKQPVQARDADVADPSHVGTEGSRDHRGFGRDRLVAGAGRYDSHVAAWFGELAEHGASGDGAVGSMRRRP